MAEGSTDMYDHEQRRDSVMDIVACRPGVTHRYLIGVRTLDGRSAHACEDQNAAMQEEALTKYRRYGTQVWALVMELRGVLHDDSASLLEALAYEAAQMSASPPATALLRRWVRALQCTLAFETVECRRILVQRVEQ